jgi:hypothetical protein
MSFFDLKSAFCIVMTKQNKIFSNYNWHFKFQWLLYVPPTLKLSITLHSVRTFFLHVPYVSYKKTSNYYSTRHQFADFVGDGIFFLWGWNCTFYIIHVYFSHQTFKITLQISRWDILRFHVPHISHNMLRTNCFFPLPWHTARCATEQKDK